VQALSTLANGSQFVKRIAVMDQPGENHFAEALAKALGPTAKGTTAAHRSSPLLQSLSLKPPLSTGFSSSNPADATALLLLQLMSHNSMQMQQSAAGGLGTQNSSSTFGTLPQFLAIFLLCHPILVPGTTATGGGTQGVPTPAYIPKTLAILLKNGALAMEQVATICTSQGIDVDDVCSAALDQPTPRTRGSPRGALRPTGGSSRRTPASVEFQDVGSNGDEQTPAQSPSLKSALDSVLNSIFTPLSEAPEVDGARADFLKQCIEETFLSAGKLDTSKNRVLKAAGKVGLQPPTGCGPGARGSGTQLAAFAENVAMAGPGTNPVQVFRTCRDLHWEFLRLWTGFELPSSCVNLP
jgi:hypothetical protein